MRKHKLKRLAAEIAEPGVSLPAQFWIGAGLGLLLSAAAVVIATEFTFRRGRRPVRRNGFIQNEGDLVEDIGYAVRDGLDVLTNAARQLGDSFGEARRELIRFGLDPVPTSWSGASSWFGDDPTSPLEDEGDGADEARTDRED